MAELRMKSSFIACKNNVLRGGMPCLFHLSYVKKKPKNLQDETLYVKLCHGISLSVRAGHIIDTACNAATFQAPTGGRYFK